MNRGAATRPGLAQPVAYAVAHFAAVGLGGDAGVAVGIGQVGAVFVVGDTGSFGGLVADGMVDGLDRVVGELAGAVHLAVGPVRCAPRGWP